jgi:hypothetical protein
MNLFSVTMSSKEFSEIGNSRGRLGASAHVLITPGKMNSDYIQFYFYSRKKALYYTIIFY